MTTILAAGLSPAWQQTILLDRLRPGEVNRACEVHWCASGKVINVSLALHALWAAPALRRRGAVGKARQNVDGLPPSAPDEETRAADDTGQKIGPGAVASERPDVRTLALVGGFTGQAIRDEFTRNCIPARWVIAGCRTRICTTILEQGAGVTTELVENAGAVGGDEVAAFRKAFAEEAGQADIAVLTGSLPQGAPATLYHDLIAATSGRVILDCQGELLLAALAARPFVVKPNREELAKTLGRAIITDGDLHAAMRILNARGAEWVVVTQGKERVWIGSANALMSIAPPVISAVNPIGSGDCLAAGIAIGLAAGYDLPDAAALGVAAAAENVRHLLPARIDIRAMLELWNGLSVECN